MLPSVRAFFAGILDYAGLFPPAKLPLDEAIRRYARYRTEPESWLLGRFVCSVEQLSELAPYGDNLLQQGEPYSFSVLLPVTVENRKEAVPAWFTIHRRMREFCQAHAGRVTVQTAEARLARTPPEDLLRRLSQFLAALSDDAAGEQGLPLVTTFFEFDLDSSGYLAVRKLIKILAQDPLRRRGYKLRCGGLHASTFPSVEQVAHVITACWRLRVPLKFTAGLHHLVRHYDSAVQTHMHGFLNVFGAGVLAHARRLSEEQVREIVADEDVGHFTFTEGGFAWRDLCASVPEITAARQQGVISFGSCSFEEPRDDLRKLGLL